MKFTRITVDPRQMGGAPCIRGLRIPVATVVSMIADGMPAAEILAAYPDLDASDIHEALRYAAEAVRERELEIGVRRRYSAAGTGGETVKVTNMFQPLGVFSAPNSP